MFLELWLTGSELGLSSMMGLTMAVGIVTEVAVFYSAEIDTHAPIGIEELLCTVPMVLLAMTVLFRLYDGMVYDGMGKREVLVVEPPLAH